MLTLAKINKAIAARGGQEQVVRRGTYFWFMGGTAHQWYETGISVTRVSDWNLEMWLHEWESRSKQYTERGY